MIPGMALIAALDRRRVTGLGLLLLVACVAAEPAHAPQRASTLGGVAALPGYRTEIIQDHVWGGGAYLMQAGPEDGPPVVMVHGIGAGASRDWHPLIGALGDRYRVTTFDLPGFGHSAKGNEAYTPADYTRFVEDVVSSYVQPPFILIGHSMGGAISLAYAAKHPADVAQLILIDVAGVLHRKAFIRALVDHSVDEMIEDSDDSEARWQRLGRRVLAPISPTSVDPSVLVSSKSKRRIALGGDPMKIAGFALLLEDFGPALDRIRVPPLLIWGTDDTIAPLRTGHVLASRIRGAHLELIEGAGHNPMRDAPVQIAALVDSWLSGTLAPDGATDDFVTDAHRIGRCYSQRNVVFEGSYRRIDINGCKQVLLRDVSVEVLRIYRSTVEIVDSDIGGGDVGLIVERSEIQMTAGRIHGDVAIRATSSELDLAGVTIIGHTAALEAPSASRALMSVCKIRTARRRGYLHGVYQVSPSVPL